MKTRKNNYLPIIAALLIGFLTHTAGDHFPEIRLKPFAWAAAHNVAFLLQCPIEAEPGQWRLTSQPIGQIVHAGCSGYNYFILFCMTATFLIMGTQKWNWKKKALAMAALLHIAIPATIGVTTFRILCAFHVRVWSEGILPDNFHAMAHLCTGLSVTVLTLGILVMVWHHAPNFNGNGGASTPRHG